jgi:hypothetical protein
MQIFEQHYKEFMAVMDKVYKKEDCTGESIWTIIEANRARGWLQEFLIKAEVRNYTHDDLEMTDFKEKKGYSWVWVDDSAQLQRRLIELLDGTLTKVEELTHDRFGSSSDPSINGHLHYPNNATSGRLHSDFSWLLFLQAHRETDRFFAASGVYLA